jgi:hypothetical protein
LTWLRKFPGISANEMINRPGRRVGPFHAKWGAPFSFELLPAATCSLAPRHPARICASIFTPFGFQNDYHRSTTVGLMNVLRLLLLPLVPSIDSGLHVGQYWPHVTPDPISFRYCSMFSVSTVRFVPLRQLPISRMFVYLGSSRNASDIASTGGS